MDVHIRRLHNHHSHGHKSRADAATLVSTSAWAVEVRNPGGNPADPLSEATEGKIQTAFKMGSQGRSKADTTAPNIQSHGHLPTVLASLNHDPNEFVTLTKVDNMPLSFRIYLCIVVRMEWLNYHHLLYFWTVVRTGSIAKASVDLRLSPPTISAQIRLLERSLGEKLLRRSGRNLVPTEVGQEVYSYADEIFSLGRELMSAVKGKPAGHPLRLIVGIADVLPKLIARRLIEPALELREPVRIVCREASAERLLAELALQELDVVLSDLPMDPNFKVRAYNHLLGECGLIFVGTHQLAKRYRRGFPKSLHGAPMLLPTDNTAIRRSLDRWFEDQGIRPAIVGEFEDDALLRVFGEAGAGIVPGPSVLGGVLRSQYGLHRIGRTDDVRGRYYAISVEKTIKHPAVMAICESARKKLFG
jgi:LysR family transcriptional activator of nhaA